MAANPTIKPTAITRAGYEYQDLVGIEVLIDYFRVLDLYEWIQLESDDEEFQALDDVVALRNDGSVEFVQVKFTVNPEEYLLDWDWLLGAKGKGSSMLSKWMKSFLRAKSQGRVHRARLVTNRVPSEAFAACLDGRLVNLAKVPEDIRLKVEAICGKDGAEEFFGVFEFSGEQLDLDRYEAALRDKLVRTDTDAAGWLFLRTFVRRWAILKNDPYPDGKIRLEHLVQLITKRRPQPISQDFYVPPGYQIPSQSFDEAVRKRIAAPESPITILWATPGRGKSTYLSDPYTTPSARRGGGAASPLLPVFGGAQSKPDVVLRHRCLDHRSARQSISRGCRRHNDRRRQASCRSAYSRRQFGEAWEASIPVGPVLANPIEECVNAADPREAVEGCTTIIASNWATDDQLEMAFNNRANANSYLGHIAIAIDDYGRALALDPHYGNARYNRGALYLETGQFDLAISDLDGVIDLQQSRPRGT